MVYKNELVYCVDLLISEINFFQFDCYDWDSDGSDDLIGTFTTTFNEMLKANEREVH